MRPPLVGLGVPLFRRNRGSGKPPAFHGEISLRREIRLSGSTYPVHPHPGPMATPQPLIGHGIHWVEPPPPLRDVR